MNFLSFSGFFQRTCKQTGSALVLVLVTGSGVLVAGFSTLHLMMSSIRAAESSIAKQQMDQLTGQINSLLKNERSCRLALGGPVQDCPAGASQSLCPMTDRSIAQPINSTVGLTSNVVLYQLPDAGGNSQVLFSPSTTLTPNRNTFGHLTIKEITITPEQLIDAANGLYLARLNIKAGKPKGLVGNDETFSGDQKLSIRIRGGNLISCSATTVEQGGVTGPLPSCIPGQGMTKINGETKCVTLMCNATETRSSSPGANGNYTCTPI